MLTDQRLGVLDPPTEVMAEPGPGDQGKEDLRGSFSQSKHNEEEESPGDAHPYLGKLESIEEPGQEVDGLILTMGNSLDTETLLGDMAGEDLAGQVDEVSNGRVDQESLMEVQPCDETTEKPSEMVLQSIYSAYALPSCSAASVLPATVESKNGAGLKGEESMDQDHYGGAAEDLNVPDGSRDCKNRDLAFSLEQDEINMAASLPADGIDTKPPDLKFPASPDGGGEKKPHELELPVKVEETKTETAGHVYPDGSEFRHEKFLSYRVKSEHLVTKAEPEDLSPPMKAESLDTKPEGLQFAVYSHGAEIKPEAKPVALGFAPHPDGAKLKMEAELIAFPDTSAIKPEAKLEGPEFSTYPDSSEIKPEAKPEDLDFSAFPEIKAEAKQELLEADSTVLTPKLEQADGLVDSSESLEGKGQMKEERPATPGENQLKSLIQPQCA